jgi:hypothetical protein
LIGGCHRKEISISPWIITLFDDLPALEKFLSEGSCNKASDQIRSLETSRPFLDEHMELRTVISTGVKTVLRQHQKGEIP